MVLRGAQYERQAEASCARAIERLMRDLKELRAEPCRTVCAAPLESNLLCWHGNLRPLSGPYEGTVLHIIMEFTVNYPSSPPRVRLCHPIPHPNVFGTYICLDMLKDHTSEVPYAGWSSAYSVQSILLQLQGFLFAENVPQEYGGSRKACTDGKLVQQALLELSEFRCEACGHTAEHPQPPLPEEDAFVPCERTASSTVAERSDSSDKGKQRDEDEATQTDGVCHLFDLPIETLLHILKFLSSRKDLLAAANASGVLEAIVREYCLLDLREGVICFHSKRTHEEDVLGVGIRVETVSDQQPMRIKAIHTSLDVLSLRAYDEENVRLSVWKERFDMFLPLVISPEHFGRARQRALDTLAYVAQKPRSSITNEREQAQMLLAVLPKLMNSFVVALMNNTAAPVREGDPPRRNNSEVLSERALEGYCSFHHMLLSFANENPELERMANEVVNGFVASPLFRSKAYTPDLGEWLVHLTLSRASWKDVAEQFLGELFVRNARWILQDAPHLATIDTRQRKNAESALMIDDAFIHTLVSRRLVMFQVYFLKNIGRLDNQSWRDTLTLYNRTMGHPTQSMKAHLHAASKAIMAVGSWDEYFDRLGMPRMSGTQLTARLGSAIVESAARNYHQPRRGFVPRPVHQHAAPRFLHKEAADHYSSSGSSSSRSSSSSSSVRGKRQRSSSRDRGDYPSLTTRRAEERRSRDEDRQRPAKRHRRSDSRSRSRSRDRSIGRERHHRMTHELNNERMTRELDNELPSRRRSERRRYH